MKVVIAGGLGYIGSALVDLMKTDDTVETVHLIDNVFIPQRVANLPDKFFYINEDIANIDRLQPYLDAADVIIVLAGLVEAERSVEREDDIWATNYHKCRNFIERCPKSARVMFASTGNVFGGVDAKGKWQDLNEQDAPAPKLPYASSKVAVEEFLAQQVENYTVCRFGTNFGYSPGVRFNLVTNIFVRRILEGKDLVLYGGGKNWRPSVHVQDAARGILHLAKLPQAARETYHIVRHNMTIRELGEACMKYGTTSRLVVEDRPVPFNSYALSSDKILATGFEFQWDLDGGLQDMFDRFRSLRV